MGSWSNLRWIHVVVCVAGLGFYVTHGSVLCAECSTAHQHPDRGYVRLSQGAVKLYETLLNETEREIFLSAESWVPETSRPFYMQSRTENQSCWPVVLHVRREK